MKAVAVNTIGVYSPVAEFDYTINYQKPDAPVISPSSGTYEYGEKISIDAADGTKIYYTTDGSNAIESETKTEYSSPIKLKKEGIYTIRAYSVDKNGKASKEMTIKYTLEFIKEIRNRLQ